MYLLAAIRAASKASEETFSFSQLHQHTTSLEAVLTRGSKRLYLLQQGEGVLFIAAEV